MQIHGFQKTTLLDYPGHLACTIFLGSCNFRCPFCHNKGLVLSPHTQDTIPESDIFEYLSKRKNILEGVCITGGEPTLHHDLPDFIKKIKELGFLVKLDTNGYQPDVIKNLLAQGLLDYIAMDIKSSKDKYTKLIGLDFITIQNIEDSISIIMQSGISYEFRTTLIKELHTLKDLDSIGNWIKGCRYYYLQNYKESDQVINPIYSGFDKDNLLAFQKHLLTYIQHVEIRGID